jgi:hypothetical protein
MVTHYPCLPTPPLAWDACGGVMPYQPFPILNPWMGAGFGMPTCMPDLPGAGMGLGMGVGAGLGAGLGAGIASLLGSFAFGHHHHCW